MKRFNSQFSTHMENMIEYRTALGYSDKTYRSRLLALDKFIVEKYPYISELSKSVIDDWLIPLPNETVTSQKSRASIARIFAEYLNSAGEKAYILPRGYIKGRKAFNPYIFSDAELTDIFYQIDRICNTKTDMLKRKPAFQNDLFAQPAQPHCLRQRFKRNRTGNEILGKRKIRIIGAIANDNVIR